jgi:hypothetical protein
MGKLVQVSGSFRLDFLTPLRGDHGHARDT